VTLAGTELPVGSDKRNGIEAVAWHSMYRLWNGDRQDIWVTYMAPLGKQEETVPKTEIVASVLSTYTYAVQPYGKNWRTPMHREGTYDVDIQLHKETLAMLMSLNQ